MSGNTRLSTEAAKFGAKRRRSSVQDSEDCEIVRRTHSGKGMQTPQSSSRFGLRIPDDCFPTDHLGYLVGAYEPHLQKAIRRYVRSGDTVYDIGANLGYISLSLAKRVGPTGHVAAFEPIPQNVDALRKNIANNGISNVRVFDVAASDRKGEAVIRTAGNFATSSLVWHKKNSSAEELVIKTVAIDELVKNGELAKPAFVKIDVEGAEGLALKGMQRTVAQSRPVLFIESSEAGRETTWQLLRELDYRCRSAITGKWVDGFEEYRHSDFLWLPLGHPELLKNRNESN